VWLASPVYNVPSSGVVVTVSRGVPKTVTVSASLATAANSYLFTLFTVSLTIIAVQTKDLHVVIRPIISYFYTFIIIWFRSDTKLRCRTVQSYYMYVGYPRLIITITAT